MRVYKWADMWLWALIACTMKSKGGRVLSVNLRQEWDDARIGGYRIPDEW